MSNSFFKLHSNFMLLETISGKYLLLEKHLHGIKLGW